MFSFATLGSGKGGRYGGVYPDEQGGIKKVRGNPGGAEETAEAKRSRGEIIFVYPAGTENNGQGKAAWGNWDNPWQPGEGFTEEIQRGTPGAGSPDSEGEVF
jgi:hypothetical protein